MCMKKIIALTCLAMLPLSYTAAEGYQANAQSAKQSGMGHVGVALKLGVESMHFNPAGLVFMDDPVQISLGITGVFSKGNFTDGDYKEELDNSPSTPLYVYAGFKIYDNLAAGISLTTPYGSSITWGDNWKGAQLIQEIALESYSIQPTISWKITDRLSIGAGVMMMFGNIKLNRAMIGPGELTDMAEKLINLQPELASTASSLLSDISLFDDISAASLNLKGNAGICWGFNVGAMFDINEKWTIGLSYRSKVTASVDEGDIELVYANQETLTSLLSTVNQLLPLMGIESTLSLPSLNNATFSSEMPLPSNWNVGLSYKPNNRWIISGEVQFVGWNAYKQLDVNLHPASELSIYDISAVKNYKNSRVYRLGTEFAATERLDLRLGTYFDESPVEDDYLNPETPSMNKLGITTGFSFRPMEKLSVDFSFVYTTGFGRDGSYTDEYTLLQSLPISDEEKERTFGGHYKVYALMPSIGITYAF